MPTICKRRYGQSTTVSFALVKYGRTDVAANLTAGSFELNDVLVSRDEGSFIAPVSPVGGSSSLPVPIGTASGLYTLTLQAADLECQRLIITVKDQTGVVNDLAHRGAKQWEDEYIIVETYGHPNAQFSHNGNSIRVSSG